MRTLLALDDGGLSARSAATVASESRTTLRDAQSTLAATALDSERLHDSTLDDDALSSSSEVSEIDVVGGVSISSEAQRSTIATNATSRVASEAMVASSGNADAAVDDDDEIGGDDDEFDLNADVSDDEENDDYDDKGNLVYSVPPCDRVGLNDGMDG